MKLETEDIKAEADSCAISTSSNASTFPSSQAQSYPLTAKGLKAYWRDINCKSIDGLPGVTSGFIAPQPFSQVVKTTVSEIRDTERVESASSVQVRNSSKQMLSRLVPGREQEHGVVVGFVLGALAMVVAQRMAVLASILIA